MVLVRRMLLRITLPLLRPVLVLVLVMGLIQPFQIFDTVQIGYAGHPIPAVRVIYYYIYSAGLHLSEDGLRSRCNAPINVLAIFTAIQLRLMRRRLIGSGLRGPIMLKKFQPSKVVAGNHRDRSSCDGLPLLLDDPHGDHAAG